MKKRKEYMSELPVDDIPDNKAEELRDFFKEIIDDMETAFGHIRGKLEISSLDDLDGIIDAYDIANDCADKLY